MSRWSGWSVGAGLVRYHRGHTLPPRQRPSLQSRLTYWAVALTIALPVYVAGELTGPHWGTGNRAVGVILGVAIYAVAMAVIVCRWPAPHPWIRRGLPAADQPVLPRHTGGSGRHTPGGL